jgi:protein-tyrosine-phosphatase/DNA-binding HxlR family transcriptional regulator
VDVEARARVYSALGDPIRLRIVDALDASDRTFRDLAQLVSLPGNAAAHHLAVLESAGLIERRVSEGDRRRRYISLRPPVLEGLAPATLKVPGSVLFVCTHNSARSQFAAAMWARTTGEAAESAGREPAPRVHPLAVRAARSFDVELEGATPRGYDAVVRDPELVVSVCDRAFEAGTPFPVPTIHWSIPDPVGMGTEDAFQSAFAELARRVTRLARVS